MTIIIDAELDLCETANSTGCIRVATDMDLFVQPFRLLRNVGEYQIFLNSSSNKDAKLVKMVARCEEVIKGTQKHSIKDLKLVHDASEELYRMGNRCLQDMIDGLL